MTTILLTLSLVIILVQQLQIRKYKRDFVSNATAQKITRIPVIYLGILLLTPLIIPLPVSAQSSTVNYYSNNCSPTYFSEWDLPKAIKDKAPNYQHGTTPLLIVRRGDPAKTNEYLAIFPTNGTNRMSIDIDPADNKAYLYTGGQVSEIMITSEIKNNIYSGSTDPLAPKRTTDAFATGTVYNYTPPGNKKNYPDMTANSPYDNCVATAMNITYGYNWGASGFAPFFDQLPYKTADGTSLKSCSGFPLPDIPCWIAYLVVPKTAKTEEQIENLQFIMNNKLGFLYYPFEFLGDVNDAYHSAGDWCTQTSCNKHFGSFFGTTVNFDLATFFNIAPNFANAAFLAIRGFTVISLIFMLRYKWLEVMQK